jgi:phage tail-like protein
MRIETRLVVSCLLLLSCLGAAYLIAGVQAPIVERKDPNGGYSFLVEIDGIVQASFRSVEGINVTVSVAEYRDGNDVINPRLLPGIAHYGPLRLSYGLVDTNTELWGWMEETLAGNVERKNLSIVILDPSRTEIMRIQVSQAWPSGWSVSKLDSLDKGPAIAELVIQYESLDVES